MTRGHALDAEAVTVTDKKPGAYYGMIGSRSKIAFVNKTLMDRGIPADWAADQGRDAKRDRRIGNGGDNSRKIRRGYKKAARIGKKHTVGFVIYPLI